MPAARVTALSSAAATIHHRSRPNTTRATGRSRPPAVPAVGGLARVSGGHRRTGRRPRGPPRCARCGRPSPRSRRRWAITSAVRPSQQVADRSPHLGLDGVVEVGGELVEHHHRCVTERRPGDRQALALTAAQLEPVLPETGVEAVGQRLDEAERPGHLGRPAHAVERGVRVTEADVVGDGAGEDRRVLRDPGDRPAPGAEVELVDGPAVDGDAAARRVHEPQQQPGGGGLPGPARPDQGHRLPDAERAGRARRGPAGRRAGTGSSTCSKATAGAVVGATVRAPPGRPAPRSRPTRPRRGAHTGSAWISAMRASAASPGLAGVVLEGEPAQGHEELRGQHEDGQAGAEGHVVAHHPEAHLHGDERGGRGGRPLHHQRGLEGGAQHLHRRVPEAPADVLDRVGPVPGATEGLQRGEPTDHVEVEGAQPAELLEAAGREGPGAAADDGEQQDEHRSGEQQDQRRPRVEHGDGDEDHDAARSPPGPRPARTGSRRRRARRPRHRSVAATSPTRS